MAKLRARSNSTRSKGDRDAARKQANADWLDSFRVVQKLGLALPDVTTATKYDGSPLLKHNGRFMAGIATHSSAEPNTLVLRIGFEERAGLLEDAPEAYYTTEYYGRFPIVLVRLSAVTTEILGQLLASAWRATDRKSRKDKSNFN